MEGNKASEGAADRRKNKTGRQRGPEYDFFVRRDLEADEEQETQDHSAEGKGKVTRNESTGFFTPD